MTDRTEKPGLVVAGVAGRMGRMLAETIAADDAVRLAAGTVRPGHDWAGRPLPFAGGVPVTDDLAGALDGAAGLIDFTSPAATLEMAEVAASAGVVHVIGTTGFSEDELARLTEIAARGRIVRAGNMSLGVNLLTRVAETVARALGSEFDVEVVEAHHGRKVDAPSGTALMLGEAAAKGHGDALRDVAVSGRDGHTGPREPGTIGFSAIRGGDVVGEHDVAFLGAGERVVLRHVATDRAIFARGAIRAALWAMDQPPGAYDMIDVLGLA